MTCTAISKHPMLMAHCIAPIKDWYFWMSSSPRNLEASISGWSFEIVNDEKEICQRVACSCLPSSQCTVGVRCTAHFDHFCGMTCRDGIQSPQYP
jgi:hypothetical protein